MASRVAVFAEAELQWVEHVVGLEEGGQRAVDEVFEGADEDGSHGDGTEGCWVGSVSLALPQRHNVGLCPLLGQHAVSPGVRVQDGQRLVGRVTKMPEEDGEDGVAARC